LKKRLDIKFPLRAANLRPNPLGQRVEDTLLAAVFNEVAPIHLPDGRKFLSVGDGRHFRRKSHRCPRKIGVRREDLQRIHPLMHSPIRHFGRSCVADNRTVVIPRRFRFDGIQVSVREDKLRVRGGSRRGCGHGCRSVGGEPEGIRRFRRKGRVASAERRCIRLAK